MKIQPSTVGWMTVSATLALVLLFSTCPRPDPKEKVPAKVQKTVDSLEATRPAFDDRRDSVVRVVTIDTARAVRAERLARARRDSAEGARKEADSLAALARSSADSARLWHEAYDRRTAEADQLRSSNAAADSALQAERSARVNLGQLLGASELRRRQAEEVAIPGLERAIAQLEKPCRIVGPIPCPSRRVAFLAGALGAVAAVSAVSK